MNNTNQVTNHVPTEWQKNWFEDQFKLGSKDGKCVVKHLSHVVHPKDYGGDEYHYFPLNNCGDMRYWLCIRKAAVGQMDMTLKISERDVGKVLGRGGENIRKIAKALGLRYIRVVMV